jgi:hypothetical protein
LSYSFLTADSFRRLVVSRSKQVPLPPIFSRGKQPAPLMFSRSKLIPPPMFSRGIQLLLLPPLMFWLLLAQVHTLSHSFDCLTQPGQNGATWQTPS